MQIDRNEESPQSPAAKYIETLKVALLSRCLCVLLRSNNFSYQNLTVIITGKKINPLDATQSNELFVLIVINLRQKVWQSSTK